MKLITPRWWYVRTGRSGSLLRLLLTPLSWIWAFATARRIARTQPVDPGVPVICVGNVTMGGSGKTPVAREILRLLAGGGVDAHALLRGYGGRLKGPVRVDPAIHSEADVGDEALLLAQDSAVWISHDRAAGAAAAANAGAQAIVMDDGHQNPQVRKSISLVVVDGETRGEWPFGDGAVFPAGPMREPLSVGLERADAVVVLLPIGVSEADQDLLRLLAGRAVLIARLEAAQAPPPGPQLGFAGVAKPWKVERALQCSGCDLVDFAPLPDHARLDEALVQALSRRAADLGAGLVTTEKDWARLPAAWRPRITAWSVRARFEDEAALLALIAKALDGARPQAG